MSPEQPARSHSFVDNLSNWYVRRSRRRFWKSEEDNDKIGAYLTLYECLVTLSKLSRADDAVSSPKRSIRTWSGH